MFFTFVKEAILSHVVVMMMGTISIQMFLRTVTPVNLLVSNYRWSCFLVLLCFEGTAWEKITQLFCFSCPHLPTAWRSVWCGGTLKSHGQWSCTLTFSSLQKWCQQWMNEWTNRQHRLSCGSVLGNICELWLFSMTVLSSDGQFDVIGPIKHVEDNVRVIHYQTSQQTRDLIENLKVLFTSQ